MQKQAGPRRFVVCGETLIDLVAAAKPDDTTFHTTWEALSAGSPMNSAVALAKLGSPTEFLGRVSTDRMGQQLRAHMEEAGVGLSLSSFVDDPTSIAVVDLDEQGKASYAFHFGGTANFGWQASELPELSADDWFHFGSLLCVVGPGDAVVLDWLQGVPAALSMDINVRSAVIGDPHEYWSTVEPWLATVGRRGGIAKASDDDVNFLAPAVGEGRDPLDIAREWVERYGLAMFVLTLGTEGAAVVTADGAAERVSGHRVEVVDTVGAGDTFMAGFLHAYVADPHDLRGALEQGVAASAIVCARQGAQPPTPAEVREFLAAASR